MKFSLPAKVHKNAAIILIAAIIFGLGSYLLGWSSLLTVRQIVISGAPSSAAQQEIQSKINFKVGEKLARVDSRALAKRIQTANWIESADISRNWLDGKVSVVVHPRTPVALYTEPGKPQVALDASGNIFQLPGKLPTGLAKVSANSVESGLAAIKTFTEMPKDFSAGIENLSAEGSANLVITGNFSGHKLRIIWGDGQDTLLKIKVINALLEMPENRSIHLIDVTAPHAPIVK